MAALALAACNGGEDVAAQDSETSLTYPPSAEETDQVADGDPFSIEELGSFDEPWAMTFLPDGRLLVTEKPGTMKIVQLSGYAGLQMGSVGGMPTVDYGGQGGLGDVLPHPDFADNNILYVSFAEAGDGDTRGAAVMRGTLDCEGVEGCSLTNAEVIWRQAPKVTGRGHYSHRLAFGPEDYLWITSGDRQKLEPAQDLEANLGKVIRLNEDGSVPEGNPFAGQSGVTPQIWSYGHRNLLGIAFDEAGRLWTHEMGPRGGDEVNLVEAGHNYGWPRVSNGQHYDGRDIPDHDTTSEYDDPEESWTPVISPAGFVIYDGEAFPGWQGTGLIGGLSSRAIINVALEPGAVRELDRYDMGQRIRELEQGPDGLLYVLEDERGGEGGRLLRLRPAR
ncbi:glucose dehydrogenase [Pacificimonas flava]|uniref:Glucose dehydrogenase n=2 Tax=Pacificimonas TaxID=1960290 RepID=A0A219B896_9SPHN|nr:glucose dehydrogenase [Pacificimonas flava]